MPAAAAAAAAWKPNQHTLEIGSEGLNGHDGQCDGLCDATAAAARRIEDERKQQKEVLCVRLSVRLLAPEREREPSGQFSLLFLLLLH